MKLSSASTRVLDPLERFSEIVFGLIMVLSFTCAISVAEIGREDVRAMWIGALGCNLAWGIIDAAFYLIACVSEAGRNTALLLRVQQSSSATESLRVITEALPEKVVAALQPADLEKIRTHLQQLSPPAERAKLTLENWRGAFGVFLLVFFSTLPVILPFVFIHDARLALRLSNGVAIALLFGAGHRLAVYAGLRPVITGLAMVGIGAALVALTIALGG